MCENCAAVFNPQVGSEVTWRAEVDGHDGVFQRPQITEISLIQLYRSHERAVNKHIHGLIYLYRSESLYYIVVLNKVLKVICLMLKQ